MMTDAAAKADELELKQERLQAEMQLKGTELGLKTRESQAKFQADNEREGLRIGADIARTRAEQALRVKEKNQPPKKGNE